MKIVLKTLVIIVLTSFHALAQKPKYVVIISIDGFRPEFYSGPACFLADCCFSQLPKQDVVTVPL